MDQTRLAVLIVLAALMPLVWGWSVHRLMSKLWPLNRVRPPKRRSDPRSPPPLDYQI